MPYRVENKLYLNHFCKYNFICQGICLGILYFCLLVPRHPVFLFILQRLGDLQDAMPCHWSHKCFLSLLSPREAEDFSGGGSHSKHVPLPTYLAWLQPIFNSSKLVFNHAKIKNILLVLKSLIKK